MKPILRLAIALSFSLFAAGPTVRTTLERLDSRHLDAVHQARLEWIRKRQRLDLPGVYIDYRAVLHVHAEDSDHTKGTREEVLRAAHRAEVNIVMFSDHRGPKPDTWSGMRDGVLFIPGAEEDHRLRYPGRDGEADLRFIAHGEEVPTLAADGYQGMEIYNRHADFNRDKAFLDYFKKAQDDSREFKRLAERAQTYPNEFFGAGTGRIEPLVERWDRELAVHPFTGIAGNDAHQNQIYNGTTFDPYDVAFRNVSTHILTRALREDQVRESLRDGHAYVAHDWLCDPSGFTFFAVNQLGVYDMGDRVPLLEGTALEAVLPVPAHLRLIHLGKVVSETDGDSLNYTTLEEGPYRLEASLTVDGEERPWIYSNPVYFQKPTREDLAAAPEEPDSADIEIRKDIPYVAGGVAKQRLDLYLPKGKTGLPVMVFLHGGAWTSGDRTRYRFVGKYFARHGVAVAIPSYRLIPTHAFPAQAEDAAAAFAWVYQHVKEIGGDPERIYLAGHSAGGHLAALLAVNGYYLKAYGLTPTAIRGVASLSGIYDVSRLNIFGPHGRTASPMSFVQTTSPNSLAPSFLIAYCQWDLLGFPRQARRFDAALRKAFAETELVYIPRENHISEIIHISKESSRLSQVLLDFLTRSANR